MIRLSIAIVVGALLASQSAAQVSPFGPVVDRASRGADVVDLALLSDHRAVAPGQTFTLALRFTIDEAWHLYWHNPGDSGMPPSVDWSLPEGWSVSEPHWPLPKRFVQPGDIVGYGYADELTLIYEVTVPAGASEGEASIGGAVMYLVCDDQRCLPGEAEVNHTVTVDGTAAPAEEASLIQKWRGRLPSDERLADFARSVDEPWIDDGRSGLTIDWKKKVSDVRAFPFAVKRVEVSDVVVKPNKGKSDITVHWQALAGAEPTAGEMPLLVTWKDSQGNRHGAVVRAPLADQ